MGSRVMVGVSLRRLGVIAVGLPTFGFTFAVVWSILYDLDASTRTVCHVYNFLPTVSSAIGGFAPQKYVWKICIALQAGLRFLLAFCYYHWHLRVNIGPRHILYTRVVKVTISCHLLENLSLITLTSISSTDNGDIHEYSFILFMVGSLLYMLLSCILIRWAHLAPHLRFTPEERVRLRYKEWLFIFNVSIFLLSMYLYVRHNAYCEPYVYSWFALGEYLTILSNIAFHGMCCVDFKDYSFSVLPTEDLVSGTFKNS